MTPTTRLGRLPTELEEDKTDDKDKGLDLINKDDRKLFSTLINCIMGLFRGH